MSVERIYLILLFILNNKMKSELIKFIVIGLVAGAIWYRMGERFDQKKLSPKCWEILHYHHKERLPLYIVHAKSILAGIALIYVTLTNSKYKDKLIVFIGASIIGLHIYQYNNEQDFIRNG